MSHFFADDGAKIHVKISGEGSPIVMLHGWTSSHQEWFPFLGALTAKHRVYRWDARGHGGHPLGNQTAPSACLLYTSDAADERSSVDLGGRRIIKKKRKDSKYDESATTYNNQRTDVSKTRQ